MVHNLIIIYNYLIYNFDTINLFLLRVMITVPLPFIDLFVSLYTLSRVLIRNVSTSEFIKTISSLVNIRISLLMLQTEIKPFVQVRFFFFQGIRIIEI